MKILINNNDLNEALYGVSDLGLVPTMGGLHNGHISLIKKSLKESNKTMVSIFVNPKQFNNKEDFKKYPRNYQKDLSILRKLKVDFLYLPKKTNVFDNKHPIKIKLKSKDKILCAKFRKGHFEGVLYVMDRLTNKIKPKKIFMGEKDFQQIILVKKLIEQKYKSKIIPCKTIRNTNKLALSSRNTLLSRSDLKKAESIAQSIISFKKKLTKIKLSRKVVNDKRKQLIKMYGIKIEYFDLRNKTDLKNSNTIRNSNLFIAYFINKIRLIDNF